MQSGNTFLISHAIEMRQTILPGPGPKAAYGHQHGLTPSQVNLFPFLSFAFVFSSLLHSLVNSC